MEEETTVKIEDWQSLINKPVYGSDGKEIGVVSEI
jgi:sporulation protein YlmC with PRC-barrel domain